MRTALIVEDDPEIAQLLQLHLRDIHCRTEIAADGKQALQLFNDHDIDVIILDLGLPDTDGLSLCQRLRASHKSYVPILMLTAKSSEIDRVLGLEIGADDYLTKPFSLPELLARVKALLRRVDALGGTGAGAAAASAAADFELLGCGELTIDPTRRLVKLAGREVNLTAKEFDLLAHFARHPGRVYSRAQLLDQVWGYGHDGYEHTVNSHINRLRAKIEADPSAPRYVLTVWGVGYKFAED